MKKIILAACLVSFAVTSSFACIGKDGSLPNLALVKQQYVRYHDVGQYDKDISNVDARAMQYLKARIAKADFHGKKPALVLDIDETSLSNYKNMAAMSFGGTLPQIDAAANQGEDPAILPTLSLYQYAKAHGVAVIFLTGRNEAASRDITISNLQKAGYSNWDKLILRSGTLVSAPASVYKTARRKELTEQGYDILENIGDQESDLRGGYADKTFKLPNPYYLIP